MNKKETDLLITNRLKLMREISLTPVFFAYLRTFQILTEETEEIMKKYKTSKGQVGYLLDLLPRRGPGAYKNFIKTLQETKQPNVVSILEPDPLPYLEDERTIAENIKNNEVNLIDEIYLSKKDTYPVLDRKSETAYPMHEERKNRVVLININFDDGLKSTRHGSKKDLANLKKFFEILKYEIVVKEELKDILGFLKEENKKMNDEEGDYNLWTLVIMSHGDRNGCFDARGESLAFKKIINLFDGNNCPGLKGVPKVFIFQCCLGKSQTNQNKKNLIKYGDDSAILPSKGNEEGFESENYSSKIERHAMADIFQVFSTVEDYVSIRHSEDGSIFISVLIYVFSRFCRHEDFHPMILKVNKILSQFNTDKGIQMCQTLYLTDSKLYIF